MDTSTYPQIDPIRYNTEFSKKLHDRLDTKECKEFRMFVHSVQQTTTKLYKTQVYYWSQSLHLEV